MRSLFVRGCVCGALVAPLLAVGCGSCSHADPDADVVRSSLGRDQTPAVNPEDAKQLSLDNTTFALDLYHQLPAPSNTNLVYSPYSVSIAAAMLSAGAVGPTADGIRTALHFTLADAVLHPAFDSVDLALASRAKGQPGTKGKPFTLNVANSLWGNSSIELQKPFLDTLAVDYGSGVNLVDFVGASQAARRTINDWVSGKTADRIQDLLPDGSITSATRFVLVNAIYFDAAWATPFDPNNTRQGDFHLLDGTTAKADMMSFTEATRTGYAEGSNYQAVELTYQGDETSMVVVVPAAGAFADVETALDGDFVTGLLSALAPTEVALSLPKFTVKGESISLADQLKKMGMTTAFEDTADFSAITRTEPLHVSDVLHQAFVKVDENGTEAAAATAIVGVGTSAIIDLKVVNADRPFFYFIRDIPTNTVLFVGREVNPSE